MTDLPRWADWAPTPFDTSGYMADDQGDWLVAPCFVSRDSGPLEHSNWETLQADLRRVDVSEETWEIHRFRHWGPGWFDMIVVKPGSKAADVAQSIYQCLQDCDTLDHSDYKAREQECFEESWDLWLESDCMTDVGKHLPTEELQEEWEDDEDAFLVARDLDPAEFRGELTQFLSYSVESSGDVYVDHFDVDHLLESYPELRRTPQEHAHQKALEQTRPLPFP